MFNKIRVRIQFWIPQHLFSRFLGILADMSIPFVTTFIIRCFIKKYKVNMEEAEIETPEKFTSFNAFFTRALKSDVRTIESGDKVMISPVDGVVSQLGKINGGYMIQAKGHEYSLLELLGGNPNDAECFFSGLFMTIYLSPKDYHRIHMPCYGRLLKMIYVPGSLFSVDALTTENIPNLFARNERVVCIFDCHGQRFAMVLVGAMIVGSIETVWADTITPPRGKQVTEWSYESQDIVLQKGDEMGRFKLGSTVILCLESDFIQQFESELTENKAVCFGEKIAMQ